VSLGALPSHPRGFLGHSLTLSTRRPSNSLGPKKGGARRTPNLRGRDRLFALGGIDVVAKRGNCLTLPALRVTTPEQFGRYEC
jgi:hypothetical protein